MDPVDRFWQDWLGSSREALKFTDEGKPFRALICSLEDFKRIVAKHYEAKHPVYLSVQPYEKTDKPSHIERLFFEFDDKQSPIEAVKEAVKFAGVLKRFYHVEPFLVVSGSKGAHLYVFLKEPVSINGLEQEAKETYRRLQEKLLKGISLQTLDPHVVGNIKQLARVPFTVHEKTGRICQPVDLGGRPLKPEDIDLEGYREKGLDVDFLGKTFREVVEVEKIRKPVKTSLKRLRSEVQQLIDISRRGVDLTHEERLAVLFEMLNAGYADDDIHAVFMNQPDYNPGKTQYFIDHARKRKYKPFRGERLKEILKMRDGERG
ncbi:MAG: hypothetical protein QW796_06320 [Thermoproteota archaeon]